MRKTIIASAAAALIIAAAGGIYVFGGEKVPPAGAANPTNWATHGGGADESSFSRLKQINKGNVKRLRLEWSLDLPGERSLEATPLAVDGVLYFTGSLSVVYAVDAVSGKLLWSYDPEIWRHGPQKLRLIMPVNRGAAYADGKIFSGTLDGRLIALDAKTGKLVWSATTVEANSKHTVTGAPRIVKDKVLIGNGGADFGARGYVTAYDIHTGKQAWRFYTVPGSPAENAGDPAMEKAAKTWSGEYWKTGTGGTAWNGITYDPELDQVYIGTGNSGPYDPSVRSPGDGDNLYLASIVALNPDTGKYIWHYQVNPREAWDYKATMNIISATLMIDGRERKVLMQSPTNGFFYVLDRVTGKLISAEKTGKVTWADRIDLKTGRPVERPNIRYEKGSVTMWPGPYGTHNWQSMSYSSNTGLVYIPYMQQGVKITKPMTPGAASLGGVKFEATAEKGDGTGALLAWDPVAQKARWTAPHATLWNGGTLATAGDLVFQGTADGKFSAYDAKNGKVLWKFNAGLGIVSDPITFSVGGKQYVSILVGYGGATGLSSEIVNYGWKWNAQPRRLLTFALDGKAVLPPTAPPSFKVEALDDPKLVLDEAKVSTGRQVFMNCAPCHGSNLRSAGVPGPDLRESAIALNRDAFWQVVHEGALISQGMPRFNDLSEAQVEALYMYIRGGAREALGTRKPSGPSNAAQRF